MSSSKRLYSFFNQPLGIWLLSSIMLGLLGLSYEIYKSEKDLTQQRLILLSEIRHRLSYFELASEIKNVSCSEAVNLYQNTKLIDQKHSNQLQEFFRLLMKNTAQAYLFSEYSMESMNSLIIKYEINLNRSLAKNYIERESMPIEDIHKSLSFINYLLNTKDLPSDKKDTVSGLYLMDYKEITNYFQYAYARYYLGGQYDTEELDCKDKMLGNIPT